MRSQIYTTLNLISFRTSEFLNSNNHCVLLYLNYGKQIYYQVTQNYCFVELKRPIVEITEVIRGERKMSQYQQ